LYDSVLRYPYEWHNLHCCRVYSHVCNCLLRFLLGETGLLWTVKRTWVCGDHSFIILLALNLCFSHSIVFFLSLLHGQS
jgi:hypothetical protein